MNSNDVAMYEAFQSQMADEQRQQNANRAFLENQYKQQAVREILEENYGYDSSINLEKLITDTYENLRDDEFNDPDVIASVAASLLDEAEIGEYDIDGEELG